jgi:hypothetical protein
MIWCTGMAISGIKIGFIGRRHVGKSTAKQVTIDLLRKDQIFVVELAFADALKNAYVQAFRRFEFEIGIDPIFTREELNRTKDDHRQQLEDFGTKFGRGRFGDDIWARVTEHRIMQLEAQYQGNESIVVDDCRFLNEAAVLQNHGFTLVRLHRSEYERGASIVRSRGIPEPTSREIQEALGEYMPSENEVDSIECDYTLTNTGNYDDLAVEIQQVIDRIKNG